MKTIRSLAATHLKTARAAAEPTSQRAGQTHHFLLLEVKEAHVKGTYRAATLAGATVRVLARRHELLAHRVLQYVLVVHFAARENCRVNRCGIKVKLMTSSTCIMTKPP